MSYQGSVGSLTLHSPDSNPVANKSKRVRSGFLSAVFKAQYEIPAPRPSLWRFPTTAFPLFTVSSYIVGPDGSHSYNSSTREGKAEESWVQGQHWENSMFKASLNTERLCLKDSKTKTNQTWSQDLHTARSGCLEWSSCSHGVFPNLQVRSEFVLSTASKQLYPSTSRSLTLFRFKGWFLFHVVSA